MKRKFALCIQTRAYVITLLMMMESVCEMWNRYLVVFLLAAQCVRYAYCCCFPVNKRRRFHVFVRAELVSVDTQKRLRWNDLYAGTRHRPPQASGSAWVAGGAGIDLYVVPPAPLVCGQSTLCACFVLFAC